MASKVSRTCLIRNINNRHYASAAPKLAGTYGTEFNVTTLPNNTLVASTESLLPLSRLSVVVKAGSRYDPVEAPGLNHVLRSCAGLTTCQSTRFGIIRNIQQLGANISCTGSRDTLTYTLEASCDKLQEGLKFLKDVIVNQVFKPWELEENVDRIKFELSTIPPQARLVDLLHTAAYKSGLGNSLYVEDFLASKIETETLQHFVASTFTSSRTAVVGVGVDHNTVGCFASDLELTSAPGPKDNSAYVGGNVAVHGPSDLAFIGVVAESAGLADRDVHAYNVLKYALGGWSSIKWTAGNSPLAALSEKFNQPIAVSAFNTSHHESGLFGVLVATSSRNAKAATIEAVRILQGAKLSEDQIKAGKNQLIRELHELNGEERAAHFGNQLLHVESPPKSTEALISAIDNVKSADVIQALKTFSSGVKTIAAYGKLADVVYADELK